MASSSENVPVSVRGVPTSYFSLCQFRGTSFFTSLLFNKEAVQEVREAYTICAASISTRSLYFELPFHERLRIVFPQVRIVVE